MMHNNALTKSYVLIILQTYINITTMVYTVKQDIQIIEMG